MPLNSNYPRYGGFFFAGLFCLFLNQCPNPIQVNLPAAQTPVLETILDADKNRIAPFAAPGVFQMSPGGRIELRFRAPYPSDVGVSINGQALPKVTDTAAHPELDGFFRIQDVVPVTAPDGLFFWRVYVSLPQAEQGSVNFSLSITDTSQDPNLSGTQKVAIPATFTIFRQPNITPQPSAILLAPGNPVPDQKHPRDGDDGALIVDNITLAGWLIDTPTPANGDGWEDIHYSIFLDNDFIERNYKATTNGLDQAMMPGRWFTQWDNIFRPKKPIPLTSGQAPTAGTFLTLGEAADYMNVEMNAWHKSKHGNQAPAGWVPNSDPAASDIVFPFDVTKPFNLGSPLQAGDYVIINGALVEDSGHLHQDPSDGYWRSKCWDDHFVAHSGWLEIHPVDGLRRVSAPQTRKHVQLVQVCDNGTGHTPNPVNLDIPPEPPIPPSDFSQLHFREIVDDRFTDLATVSPHVVEVDPCDPTKLHVQVGVMPQGHFKAVYLLWWEEAQTKRPPPCQTRPATIPKPDDPPVCSHKPYLPQCDNESVR